MKIESFYEPFRSVWGAKGNIFGYSDPHFTGLAADDDIMRDHFNYLSNDRQIENINHFVFKNDTLIILGDIGNPNPLKKLRAGYKILITGNHDRGKSFYKNYFDEIYDGPLFISNKVLLSHEPILSDYWFNIHGHNHNINDVELYHENQMCLSANIIGYSPINIGKFLKEGGLKNVKDIHRHFIDSRLEEKKNVL